MITERLLFSELISEVTVWKSSKQTLPQVEKVIVQELVLGFWTVVLIIKLSIRHLLRLLLENLKSKKTLMSAGTCG